MESWPLTKHSRGQRTSTAQWLMQGHNVYKIHTYKGAVDGISGALTAAAFKETRRLLGFADKYVVPEYGPVIQEYLLGKRRLPIAYRLRRFQRLVALRKTSYYPLANRGAMIGTPGVGTHSWWVPPNNWQSDNAVDIQVPQGTQVRAYKDGVIGQKMGPLQNGASRFHGERLYLETADGNQFYYAHLSKIIVQRGQRVKAGQVLGYSGNANGVYHLHWAAKHGDPVALLRGL